MSNTWIGKSLSGRYELEELLGQGGMSAVYKATDPNLKRVVAVKLIHTHLSDDPGFVRRFEEEASSVAQLRHPNIIQVFDFNHDDESDSYYMVLEFVPGETVQEHLERLNKSGRKLSSTKAIEYMVDICDAVGYAHQRGMIHRDIKPANLMISVTGQAILMDFGIAKIVGGQSHTATGAVVGTAMYMSPEQIKGESPDNRSDIYSLGVTLFEMVSGQPPFKADSAMTLMMMHVNDPVPDLKGLNPDVPNELITVINKALAKDPGDRYQTAAQMAAALREVLSRAKTDAKGPLPPGETMVEEPAKPAATVVEPVPASASDVGGTLVETDMPQSGTVVETPVESSAPSAQASQTAAGAGVTGLTGTGTGSSAPGVPAGSSTKILGMSIPVLAGGGIVLICLIAGGIFMITRLFSGGIGASAATATEKPAVVVLNTEAPTETAIPESTATSEPTETPTETAVPPTPTPDSPYVVITDISLDNSYYYVVDYEVHNFPDSPQLHVHMFFDTVPPDQAGSPGSGPWKLTWGPYGDPPFRQYAETDRPSGANQMCALVANPNHSVQANSGNCVDLP
ncbi:MAG: serine/threonine-protein kinase [Anaerolineales bacterium]